MPSLSDRWHHEFTAALAAATRQAGYTIDPDELDVTVAHHADEVVAWVLAAGHYAATGYLADLFDAPIEFLHDMAAEAAAQDRDTDLELIAYLRSARDVRRVAHGLARVALTSACQTLSTTALLWPLEPASVAAGIDAGDPLPSLIEQLACALTGVGMRAFRPADPHTRAAWRHRDGAADVTVAVRRPEPATVTITTRRNATELSVATIPADADPTVIIAAAYNALNTLAAPQPTARPRWLAAQVSLPNVGGPYPARIIKMAGSDIVVSAKLTAATVHAVIDDCRNRAEQVGVRPTRIRQRYGLIDLIDYAGTPDEAISTLAPDADGFYHLRWTWRLTTRPTGSTPPAAPGTADARRSTTRRGDGSPWRAVALGWPSSTTAPVASPTQPDARCTASGSPTTPLNREETSMASTAPTHRVARALTPEELDTVLTAVNAATSTADLLADAIRSVFTALMAGTGTAFGEFTAEHRLNPGDYAIPTPQWNAIAKAITDHAAQWGTAAQLALDLIATMPASYDDPTAYTPTIATVDRRPLVHHLNVSRDAVDVIAACERHITALADAYGHG